MFLSRVLQRLPPSGVELRLREPDPVLLTLIRRYRRILQFATVGVSGVLVNMASVWAGLQLVQAADPDLRDALASALGILVSVFTNFLLNDVWTWGDREKGSWLSRLARYYLVSAAAALLQFGCAMGLRLLLDINLYLAQFSGIALGTIVNYVANNRWTFKD